MSSSQKFVLITGCSAGGIGAALAEAFQERGYHVFATLRNPSKISKTLSNAKNVTILTLDVLSSESIAAAVESVKAVTGGRLDILVNNSGGGLSAPALDAPIEESKKVFDLNFWAPFAMLQAFAAFLIKAKGCVVNNSSANAYLPMPFMSVYNASKAALATVGETWRHELQPLGVRTFTLITFAVKTNALKNGKVVDLPETSYYYEVQNDFREIRGKLQNNAMDSKQYAFNVLDKIEKGSGGLLWVGQSAFLGRLLLSFLPHSLLDKVVQSIIPLHNAMTKVAQRKAPDSQLQ